MTTSNRIWSQNTTNELKMTSSLLWWGPGKNNLKLLTASNQKFQLKKKTINASYGGMDFSHWHLAHIYCEARDVIWWTNRIQNQNTTIMTTPTGPYYFLATRFDIMWLTKFNLNFVHESNRTWSADTMNEMEMTSSLLWWGPSNNKLKLWTNVSCQKPQLIKKKYYTLAPHGTETT